MTHGMHKTILPCLAIAAGLTMLVGTPAHSLSASNHSEYEVKAAYLYNFGRFIEWPHDAPSSRASDFSICVLGHDPFGQTLDTTISGERIDSKNVVARRISAGDEAGNCRELFISSSEDKRIKEILSAVSKQGVLTVSDMPQFIQQGGMVQFVVIDERVRFQINLAAAQQGRLNMSSELLKVAAGVR
jgi:hypothetical protein